MPCWRSGSRLPPMQARIRLLEARIVRAIETRMTGRARASPNSAADLKRGTRRSVLPNV
jgi:hypothetical protein